MSPLMFGAVCCVGCCVGVGVWFGAGACVPLALTCAVTCGVVWCHTHHSSCEHTLNTLRYADRYRLPCTCLAVTHTHLIFSPSPPSSSVCSRSAKEMKSGQKKQGENAYMPHHGPGGSVLAPGAASSAAASAASAPSAAPIMSVQPRV
jgi:hypothetical protein